MSWGHAYYRHSSNTSREVFYFAGDNFMFSNAGNMSRDVIYFLPFMTGHGGCIRGVGIYEYLAGAGVKLYVGMYSRVSTDNPLPYQLLGACGSLSCVGLQEFVVASCVPTVVMTPHDQVWLAVMCNSAWTAGMYHQGALPTIFGGAGRTDLNLGVGFFTQSWGFSSGLPATVARSAQLTGGGGGEFPGIMVSIGSIVAT